MHVRSLMKTQTHSCSPTDTLSCAAQLMWDHDIGCLPVLDDEQHVVGILTDRDICMAAYTKGQPLAAARVADVMQTDVRTISPDATIDEVHQVLRSHQIHRLPVADAQMKLVGMISLIDIVAHLVKTAGIGQKQGAMDVAKTLDAIRKPRAQPQPLIATPREARQHAAGATQPGASG